MIFIERTITIKKNTATIDEPIQLFIGDGNVEIQFTIKDCPFKHRTNLDSTYAKLMINRPSTYPVFSECAKLKNNKVLFVITTDMIDEFAEAGEYDFQITLHNCDQTSKATLPPVTGGIIIGFPICNESIVGYARAGLARAISDDDEEEVLDPFDSAGNYNLTDWEFGDLITAAKLDKIENAIYDINDTKAEKDHNHDDRYLQEVPSEYVTEDELLSGLQGIRSEIISYVDEEIDEVTKKIPTKVSQLENDAKYTTEAYVDELRDYVDENFATITYTDNKFTEAKTYIDNKFTEAKTYTNTKFTEAKNYTDTEITEAKAYTDSEVTKAIAYTDSEVAELKDHVETNYALKSEIPTKVSELENDVPYVTEEDLSVINDILTAINNGTTPSALTLAYDEESGNLAISGTDIDDTNLEI